MIKMETVVYFSGPPVGECGHCDILRVSWVSITKDTGVRGEKNEKNREEFAIRQL